ncbi:PREDICTED: killer cell lectin-like receptor 4 isoform X2 [Condylura cristata]|nr:PREDICTED: killer cell lectin-like receptor 4 isoform X2 [Condylura cristata]
MSDQEVIYSTVKVQQPPSGSQNHRLSPGGTQRTGKTHDKGCSVSRDLTMVILGILCLLLLITVLVLGTKVFQYSQEIHQWEERLQNHDIMKNDCYLKEQHLINKTLEYDILKNETLQKEEKLHLCFTENKLCPNKMNLPKCSQNTGILGNGYWSCLGVSCYYFITESQDWYRCKQTCENYGSSLLKIDDDDELTFIRSQICPYNYWIGLSYNNWYEKWEWIDSDASR